MVVISFFAAFWGEMDDSFFPWEGISTRGRMEARILLIPGGKVGNQTPATKRTVWEMGLRQKTHLLERDSPG